MMHLHFLVGAFCLIKYKEEICLSDIVYNAFSSLCKLVQSVICLFLQWLTTEVRSTAFVPTRKIFISDEYGFLTENLFNKIQNAFLYLSAGLIILFFMFQIVTYWKYIFSDSKETILETFMRPAIALIGIRFMVPVLDSFLTWSEAKYNELFVNGNIISDLTISGDTVLEAFNPDSTRNILSENMDFVASSETLTACFIIVQLLLQIIFFSIVAYNFAKLVVEIIKRFVFSCFMYMCAPVFVSFFTTAESQNVLYTYIKVFGVNIATVYLTKFWIQLSLYVMATKNCNFTNMCIMIAIIQIGVKLESHLKDFGLSTVNMGVSLLDNIASTGAAMAFTAKNVSSGSGKVLTNMGGLMGNVGLASIGSALNGKPINPSNVAMAMNESAGANIREKLGKNSTSSNFTKSQGKSLENAIKNDGIFRNQTLQGTLGRLNSAGQQSALSHVFNTAFKPVSDKIASTGGTITGLGYSSNDGFSFSYKSGMNNITRQGTINDAPKRGNGIVSIPFQLSNGKMAYANLEPMSMNSIHNSGVDAFYNNSNESLESGSLTSMELDTGMKMDQFIFAGDTNASHYAATPNNTGGLDIRYNSEGINSMNIDKSPIVGAITQNGQNLKATDYKWGSSDKTPEQEICNTFSDGAWSNIGLSNVKPQDVKLDSTTGMIQFSATEKASGKLNSYTAFPSVSIQNKVTKNNTVTDPTLGSYTFIKTPHATEKNIAH